MTRHIPGLGAPLALASMVLAVSLTLIGCSAPTGADPEAAGYFPYYGRGIDQDVSIGHDSTQPLAGNLHLHNAQPWQISR